MEILSPLGVFLFTFLQRKAYLLLYPRQNFFDSHFHSYFVSAIRKQHRVPEIYPQFLTSLKINYPFFLHYLISWLPISRNFLLYNLNAVMESVVVAVAFTLLAESQGYQFALSAVALYVFSPITFTVLSTGPRVLSFTPRLFSELITYGLLGLIWFIAIQTPEGIPELAIPAVLALLLSSTLVLSSQFGMQVYALLVMPVAFISSGIATLILSFAFPIAILLGGPQYRDVLTQKGRHYLWYIKQLRAGTLWAANRSVFSGLFSALAKLDMRSLWRELFYNNPFCGLFLKAPLIVAAIVLIFQNHPLASLTDNVVLIGCLGSLFLFIITSSGPLLFLGEAERYLCHALPLFVITTATLADQATVNLLIAYGMTFFIAELVYGRVYSQLSSTTAREDTAHIMNFLNKLEEPRRLITSPIHLGGWKIIDETEHSWLTPFESIADETGFFQSYEELDLNQLSNIFNHFDADLLITSKDVTSELPHNFDYSPISERLVVIYPAGSDNLIPSQH